MQPSVGGLTPTADLTRAQTGFMTMHVNFVTSEISFFNIYRNSVSPCIIPYLQKPYQLFDIRTFSYVTVRVVDVSVPSLYFFLMSDVIVPSSFHDHVSP